MGKIESFIRSKYESRRWAMRQAVPDDPAVLDTLNTDAGQQSTEGADHGRVNASASARHGDENGSVRRTAHPLLSTSSVAASARATPTQRSHHQPPPYTMSAAPPKVTSSRPTPTPTFDLLGGDLTDLQPTSTTTATPTGPAPPVPGNRPTAAPSAHMTQRQPELAAVVATGASTTRKSTSNGGPGAGAGASAGLFDLDFRPPTSATSGFSPTTTTNAQKAPKSSMNDIMSLFSSASAHPQGSSQANGNGSGHVGGFGSHSYAPSPQQQHQPQPQQQQYQSQAIYGAPGSSNSPPTLVSPGNGQASYATWSASTNGITSSSAGSYAGGAETGTAGLTRGMGAMGLNAFGGGGGGGADVWASSSSGNEAGHKSYAKAQPAATTQPTTVAPTGSNNSHYFSSADVWGTPSGGTANGSNSTYGNANTNTNVDNDGGFGGAFAAQTAQGNTANVISDDPFANIWK
ncbi:hypothetical protein QFC24_002394 [Naganishia onofrii]|uniref:Uncharacterized protein n=1 Tax=Naganishia onofrii TaxID=1851511 RepID=A0ACC2XRV9_9TREE|nr:hypothetical protein QFC24_002394 [Naganishia onofrii]